MRSDSRINFYPLVVVDGEPVRDVLSGYFYRFRIRQQPGYHRVMDDEVYRPDLISFREYGTVNLWWFLLKVNAIVDPFSLEVGQLLTIPTMGDYFAFYREAVSG